MLSAYVKLLIFFLFFSPHSFGSVPASLTGMDVVSGQPTQASFRDPKAATVVIFMSAKCPCSASHEDTLKELFREFSDKGIQFVGIHSNRDEDSEFVRNHFKESAFAFPILADVDNKAANALGAFKTPHVFVISKNGTMLYQGGVDDRRVQSQASRHYLREALVAILDGKEPRIKESRTLGCIIPR